MTGSTDLTREQFQAVARWMAEVEDVKSLVRVIFHPQTDVTGMYRGTVKVETRSLSFGDVVCGHFFVLPNGERLTGREWADLVGIEVRP
jgi:hypothetical protein